MFLERACVITRITALYVDKLASGILAPYELSLAQYKILTYLYEKPPKTVTVAELEKHFWMTHSTSVELLNKLEKAGWIIREKNPSMSRRKVVSITEKAVRMKPELSSAGATLEEEFTKNLTEQEVAEYVRLSNKILREE